MEDDGPEADGSDRDGPEHEHSSFTFEGQIERLQRFVVGVNRRGGREKRVVQTLVITGIALLLLAYFSGIFWGIFVR